MDKKKGWIYRFDHRQLPVTIGRKAANLYRLQRLGFTIPSTFVISWEAWQRYQEVGESALDQLRVLLNPILDNETYYAVRSSADVEDDHEHSFAGMFHTELNVKSVNEVLASVEQVWNSVHSEQVKSYLALQPDTIEIPKMGVILQEMVQPLISGVAFSRNPVTMLDEQVIEAVLGLGTQLVEDGVTPYRWVNKWGTWIEQPSASPVHMQVIEQVAAETREIARETKMDVDLEWAYDGNQLYWLQVREITGVTKENIYSNKMSREMMPGLVHPLVWSVNVPSTAGAWIDLLQEILGKRIAEPFDLVKSFHYQSYFNVGVFGKVFDELSLPRETLEIMQGITPADVSIPHFRPSPKTLLRLPRLLSFLYDKWTFGKKAERRYPAMLAQARQLPTQVDASVSLSQILVYLDQAAALNHKLSYHLIVSMLLMQAYNQALNALLKSAGIDFQQFDATAGLSGLEQYDPSHSLASLNELFQQMPDAAQALTQAGAIEELRRLPEAHTFLACFDNFMEAFGHMSDATTNFTRVPWRETPEMILKLAAEFQRRVDPSPKIVFADLKLRGSKGWLTQLFYKRARQFRLLREEYSSLYTFTLMLFRDYYLAIGDRFVAEGFLEKGQDIFYLYHSEIRAGVDRLEERLHFSALIARRQEEMSQAEGVILPEVVFGEKSPPLIKEVGRRLSGTPTSRGYYTGKVKVIQGIADFPKLESGDVLVIPYSDVGWLPLFAKAGAVIAQSGGILSHSSIIAREYGIPAVVSVSGALGLCDNTVVSIDGYKGEIIIHSDRMAGIEQQDPV